MQQAITVHKACGRRMFAEVFISVYLCAMKTDVHEKTLDELYYDGSLSFEEYKHLRRVAKCREYGLPEDTYYLSFERISGGGTIYCEDCGHREKVIGFTHGAYECDFGRQCPQCHTFVVEHNSSTHYHTIGPFTEDCLCPKCGAIVHGKDEPWDKGQDSPLFCPQCHSYNLEYHMEYIT